MKSIQLSLSFFAAASHCLQNHLDKTIDHTQFLLEPVCAQLDTLDSRYSFGRSDYYKFPQPLVEDFQNIDEPWTFPPRCTIERNSSRTYCAYVAQKFHSGRGISLVTTPEIANYVAEIILSIQNGTKTLIPSSNVLFEPQHMLGKGIGLIANTTVNRGNQIMANSPVLFVHGGVYNGTNLEEGARSELIRAAVFGLPEKTQEAFFALMGHFGGDEIEDRIDT
jgi:hypothetical protein